VYPDKHSGETIQQKFRRLLNGERIDNCPFLGFRDDQELRASYASSKNYCHCVEKPLPASRSQQEKYCLTSSFATCKIYQGHVGEHVLPASSPYPANPGHQPDTDQNAAGSN
jgi:hypothetical protein